jgi:hypothetical protein
MIAGTHNPNTKSVFSKRRGEGDWGTVSETALPLNCSVEVMGHDEESADHGQSALVEVDTQILRLANKKRCF